MGAECVFSSEWDRFAQQTYAANFGETPFGDIREIDATDVPDHDILLAGFPCQPFSIAGVSKKNSLGHAHGFADDKQGNLFFDIVRILETKKPQAFLLENVRNLKTHDHGRTFEVIRETLQQLDYNVSYQVLDAKGFVPQHRERIFIVGFHRDVWPDLSFTFPKLPLHGPRISDILEDRVDDRYTLSDHLWDYLQDYAAKHRRLGNGFGFGLVDPARDHITRTLSARYYKDGSEILIKQDGRNPRRLTPRECARLMGFPDNFEIPVSDTQAYRQFGNSVVVPLVEEMARTMLGWQESVKAISALSTAYVDQIKSMLTTVDQIVMQMKQTDAEMKATIEAILAFNRSALGSNNKTLENINMVSGNLAEMLKHTPQPFTAFELSSYFAQKSSQIDFDLLRSMIVNSHPNGAAGQNGEVTKNSDFASIKNSSGVKEPAPPK